MTTATATTATNAAGMTADQLRRHADQLRHLNYLALTRLLTQAEARLAGTRGAPAARARIAAALSRIGSSRTPRRSALPQAIRRAAWIKRSAEDLATKAGSYHNDCLYTWDRGTYLATRGLDYVPAYLSAAAPYHDLGGAGMGLIAITRRTCYSKSSGWGPSDVATRYLVGRNESGSYWTHPVPVSCATVIDALEWLWDGRGHDIIERQGDISLVRGRGPRMPRELPDGHTIDGSYIVHRSHAPLRLPQSGERIIIARRAAARSAAPTRD
ncbi:MAG: hypothetical protein KGZ53_03635 [Peptococcaceae bacterium]|nr:hypothetical protein [Peptococcaceae bacterium]